jgi:hypothetical protein
MAFLKAPGLASAYGSSCSWLHLYSASSNKITQTKNKPVSQQNKTKGKRK